MLGTEFGKGFETAWLSLIVALLFLITALLRLVTMLIQSADAAGRLKQVSGTVVGALVWTLALPGRNVQGLAAQRGPWGGVFHPVGFALAFFSALLAWLMGTLPDLGRWSERAPWVLLAGLVAYGGSAAIVARWPPTSGELRRLKQARDRVARGLSARARAASIKAQPELQELRARALARIDDELLPPFKQLLQRNGDIRLEILAYQRASRAPDPDVLERLRSIQHQYEGGTDTCVQQAFDAEAALFALLQHPDDAIVAERLRRWTDGIGPLIDALVQALTVPPWTLPPPQPHPSPRLEPDGPPERPKPQPADFADLARRALRALNSPGTLARSDLLPLLPRTIRHIWQLGDGSRLGEPTPLEQGQALRELLKQAIERLNVSDDGGPQAHQYQVLRMQYLLGMTVVQVAIRLSIAQQGVFRRSAEGVAAVANDLWEREQQATARRQDPVAMDYLG